MYRRTGGKLLEVSDDLRYVKLKLSLNYKTRNYVGTLYGGHMYSCTDGIFMVQLLNILSHDYVVWDKSASINFKRPGNQTLYAEFNISDLHLKQIREDINMYKEKDYPFYVNLTDEKGTVYAKIEKVIYIANKEYYRKKQQSKS